MFLTVFEAEKFKIKVLIELVMVMAYLLPGSQKAVFSLCHHMAEGVRELSKFSFIRALIPFSRVLPS